MKRVRHLVLLLLLASSITIFINRTNLNIAIVPMTERAISISESDTASEPQHYGCPARNVTNGNLLSQNQLAYSNSSRKDVTSQKHYDWDQVTQGKILGAFFYSYFIFMVPGGRIAEKFGSRWIIFSTLTGSAVASIIVPFVTDYHYSILMLCRFLLGMFQSSFYPAAYGMVCVWFPEKERSFAFATVDTGAIIGAVVTYIAAGTITTHWGWPFLFYIPGLIALLTSLLFVFGTRDQPEQHPLITEKEIKKIRNEESIEPKLAAPSPPWSQILTTPAVMATMMFKFASMTCFTFVYLELPKYLSEVVHENISDNGSINALVNIICLISMIACSAISERVIQKGGLPRTATRKLFSLFVGVGSATCFTLIPIFGCQPYALYSLLCLSTFFGGFYTASDGPIVSEMTNHFPATLYAFFNMIAMSTGFIVPYFVGLVLDSYEDPTAGWPIVFYSCSCLTIFANIIFLIFAKAERQEFDLSYDADANPARPSIDFKGTLYGI